MARHGAPRMAIAACYGGPLLSIFSMIGLAGIKKVLHVRAISLPRFHYNLDKKESLFKLKKIDMSVPKSSECLSISNHIPINALLNFFLI